jgi:hypothetical protein
LFNSISLELLPCLGSNDTAQVCHMEADVEVLLDPSDLRLESPYCRNIVYKDSDGDFLIVVKAQVCANWGEAEFLEELGKGIVTGSRELFEAVQCFAEFSSEA